MYSTVTSYRSHDQMAKKGKNAAEGKKNKTNIAPVKKTKPPLTCIITPSPSLLKHSHKTAQ